MKVAGFWDYPQAPPVPLAAAAPLGSPTWGLLLLTNAVVACAAAYAGASFRRRGKNGYAAISDTPPSLELRRNAAKREATPFNIQAEL